MDYAVDRDGLIDEARGALKYFERNWIGANAGRDDKAFYAKIASMIIGNLDKSVALLGRADSQSDFPNVFGHDFCTSTLEIALTTGAAYALRAVKEAEMDVLSYSWEYLLIAHAWRLRAELITAGVRYRAEGVSERAREAAKQRHKENHAFKQAAIDWYQANSHKYGSKDDAAMAILRLVPVKFRTARSWLNGLPKGDGRPADRPPASTVTNEPAGRILDPPDVE
jgi:hypothetical protein